MHRELPEFEAVKSGTLKALHLPTRWYLEIGMNPRILPHQPVLEVLLWLSCLVLGPSDRLFTPAAGAELHRGRGHRSGLVQL